MAKFVEVCTEIANLVVLAGGEEKKKLGVEFRTRKNKEGNYNDELPSPSDITKTFSSV